MGGHCCIKICIVVGVKELLIIPPNTACATIVRSDGSDAPRHPQTETSIVAIIGAMNHAAGTPAHSATNPAINAAPHVIAVVVLIASIVCYTSRDTDMMSVIEW